MQTYLDANPRDASEITRKNLIHMCRAGRDVKQRSQVFIMHYSTEEKVYDFIGAALWVAMFIMLMAA